MFIPATHVGAWGHANVWKALLAEESLNIAFHRYKVAGRILECRRIEQRQAKLACVI